MRVSLNEKSQETWQRYGFEYLRYKYNLTPEDVVIDIGAYRGEWASEIYKRYQCKMVLIEPGPWVLDCQEWARVINKAAGTKDGVQKYGGDFYYTSSFEPGEKEYKTFDINSLLSRFDEIALLKMNIEGAEYDLLGHIYRAGMVSRIKDLQIQFHLVESEDSMMRYEVISELLSETHSPTWEYPFCWENWRRDDA